jgi:ABC-type lipoprotein release transport system permease subunit
LHGQLPVTTATLLLRGTGETGEIAASLRRVVRGADSGLVAEGILSLEERLLTTSLARPRLYAALLAVFAIVALVVTGMGLFGVLSFTVAQRTRELGVRAALGARRVDLVGLVLRQGLGITLAGIVLGLIAALWLARFLSALLYGVTTHDPVTYVAVPLVVFSVAALACLAPALRAARLDPLRALRS